ncbi:MAG TPA: hypothetical protein VND41_02685 [Nitrososphaerales archaeon]|nr:hypothetical protein [Nitrososphaerales archaeon]
MKAGERLLLSAAVALLLVGSVLDLYEFNIQGRTTSRSESGSYSGSISSSNTRVGTWLTTSYLNGTSVNSSSDTFFTASTCSQPTGGGGGFELRVVSDSAGTPVSGETINAVGKDECVPQGAAAETQVVYIDRFSVGPGGWLMPVFPSDAEVGGSLNFTVAYQGATYNFFVNVPYPPIGSNCVTFHIPSGSVTSTNVMNGLGSYCFQG